MNNLFKPKSVVTFCDQKGDSISIETIQGAELDEQVGIPQNKVVKKRKIIKPGERLVKEFNKLSKSQQNKNSNNIKMNDPLRFDVFDAIDDISKSLSLALLE